MRKGIWNAVSTKTRHIETKLGGGIHTGLPPEEVPQGMAVEMKNLHSRTYPQLSPRPPRNKTLIEALPRGNVRFFGTIFGDILAAVVDGTLYTLGVTAWRNEGEILLNKTGRVHTADFMDWVVFADGTECIKYDGIKPRKVGGANGSPESAKFLATHAWHLFTAAETDKYLRYSAAENIDDWSAPGDAGQELVETTRDACATGLVAYGDHIIYFKENAMFELYGTDPVNFSLLCLSRDIGCIAHESIKEIGGILYFTGKDGVYRYSGGTLPKKISFPIQKYIDNMDTAQAEYIAAGSDGERYYLALPQKDGSTQVLAYDTRIGEWFAEDTTSLVGFAMYEGTFYGVGRYGTIYVFGSGDEKVSWYRISGPYTFDNTLYQNWHRVLLRAELSEGATMSVALSPWAWGEGFRTVATITKSGLSVIEVPPKLQDAPQMRIKLSGKGDVTVSALEFELRTVRRSYM